jgi:hypothetical protein
MSIKAQLIILALLPAMFGCGKVFNNKCGGELSTTEQATVNYRSDLTIGKTLSFCKGGQTPKKVDVDIPDSTYPELVMDYKDELNDKGPKHWDGACNDMDRKSYQYLSVPIALTSDSFDQAKLCYYDSQKSKIAIVGSNEACPAGTRRQAIPVDDCSRL